MMFSVVLGGSSHADVCSVDHFDLQVGLSKGGRWPGCAERFLRKFLMFSSTDSSQGTSCILMFVRRTSTLGQQWGSVQRSRPEQTVMEQR